MHFFHAPVHMLPLLRDLLLLMSKLLRRVKMLLLLLLTEQSIKSSAPLSRGRSKQRRPTGNGQTKSGVRMHLVGQLPTSTTATAEHHTVRHR